MSHPRFKNAYLRLDNAAEHIAKVNKILREQRPFAYFLETNTKTRQRATLAKKNVAVIDAIGVAASDAFSNIRAALDYGYWQVVSPFVPEKSQKGIQFPSCKEASRLKEAIKNRFAHFVSANFFDEIVALKPHGEFGGNRLLYVLEKAATPDRHRDLTPIADYTKITSEIIQRQVPDFPSGYYGVTFGSNYRDACWPAGRIDVRKIGTLLPGSFNVFEKELAVPVDILFVVAEANYRGPVVSTLNELFDLVKTILAMMERYA